MVEKVVKTYPNIKVVGTTLREVKSGLINNWSAILYADGKFYESRVFKDLEIEDRVGGGDGFSSGFAYGFLTGREPQECADLGAAHGALLQSTRGDTSMIDPRGTHARVQGRLGTNQALTAVAQANTNGPNETGRETRCLAASFVSLSLGGYRPARAMFRFCTDRTSPCSSSMLTRPSSP